MASGVVRRSLRRAGVELDTLTSLFGHAASEAVLACLISDTTDDRVTRQPATHPSQCTATQTAALHQHHTTPSSCSDRNRPQASDSGWPWSITQNGSISSLVCLPSLISSVSIFSSSFCCFSPLPAFPQSPSHPFLRGPAPRQRYSSRPTASLLWPTSPDGTRSSLLSSYPPRQSRSLCRWPIVLLACVLPLPCSPRRSRVKAVAHWVCQQKALMETA